MKKYSNTFCVLPWTHLATYTSGSVLLCCVAQNDLNLNLNETTLAQAWNSEKLKDVRKKMLAGQKVSSCTHCYREEAAGHESHRITENNAWEFRFTGEWIENRVEKTLEDGSLPEGLVSVDLRLGNTCNLTCVMCRPQDSSRWQALAKKLENSLRIEKMYHEWREKADINQSRFEWYKKQEFWQDLMQILPSLRELIIGGGEPMLLEEHRVLIEACVSSGHASHIQLRYHTNGTTLDPQIFDSWKHFQIVETFISLDGIKDHNHYLRYPASWPAIEKNLNTLDNYPHGNLRAMLLCSVHALNVYYLDEYAKWVENQNFKIISVDADSYFHPGVVHYPDYLSVQVLPEHIKKIVTEKVKKFEAVSKRPSSKIQGILNFMNQTDASKLMPEIKEYVRVLDLGRKTSLEKSLPELHALLFNGTSQS